VKRPFSDITGLPANDAIRQLDISYSLPVLDSPEFQVVARVVFSIERPGDMNKTQPDLTRDDVIELLRGLFERFRDTLRP
jgi:hypothetical protein